MLPATTDTTYEGSHDRIKAAPKAYSHEGTERYNPNCLCPSCLAEYRRRNPHEYAVTQAQPMNGARVNDFTIGTLKAGMKSVPSWEQRKNEHSVYCKTAPKGEKRRSVMFILPM